MNVEATIATTVIEVTVSGDNITAQVIETPIIVTIDNNPTIVGSTSDPGVSITAAVNISALRAVTVDSAGEVVYATTTDTATRHAIGISTNAVTAGQDVNIHTSGPLTDASWSWTCPAPVYVGVNGALTQTAPTTGFNSCVGIAIAADTIDVSIHPSILL